MFPFLLSPLGSLFALCLFVLSVSATAAPGFSIDLGITVNGLTTKENTINGVDVRYITYTGYVKYDQDTSVWLSDDDLMGLAYQAYLEMREMHSKEKAVCGVTFPQIPGVSPRNDHR